MAAWRRVVHPTMSRGRWSKHRCNPHIHIDEDGLTAEFQGDMDPACVQADFGFDGKPETPFIYWELQILGQGDGSAITMGFAHGKYDLESHPGWNTHSFALHGDDGQIFMTTGQGNIWGPRFAIGDVVGCGINPKTEEIWYTHNGKFLGIAHHHADDIPKQRWYPTMGLTAHGDKAKANFGSFPFLFTFDARTWHANQENCSTLTDLCLLAALLRFVHPKLKIQNTEDEPEQPEDVSDEQTLLPKFSVGDFYALDPEGSKLILMCRDSANWLYAFFTIDTQNWTVKEVARSSDLATARSISFFHSNTMRLYYATVVNVDNLGETFNLDFNYLDCRSEGEWAIPDESILTLEYTRKMLDYEAPSFAPHIIKEINGYIYVWHPLGTHAIRAKLEFPAGDATAVVPAWEEVRFLGEVSRTTHYTVQQSHAKDILFVFAGWDDTSQSNCFHIIQLMDIPTGMKGDDGRMITEPALKWSRPHRSGSVPRPRNDAAMLPLTDNKIFVFGGWNGRNYIDDTELVTILESRRKDPLLALLQDDDMQRLAHDVTLEFKDNKSIMCSKVVLYARSEYFRDLLKSDPSISTIDLRTVPFDLFYPLLYYLHADMVDSESIDAGSMHMFLDGIVQRFAAEHTTRIFQELYAAEVIAQSTLGPNLEQSAWKNEMFADVSFRVPDDSNSEGCTIYPAHRSIVCLIS